MKERELDDLAWSANPHTWRNNRGAVKTTTGYITYGLPPPPHGRKERPEEMKGGDRIGFQVKEFIDPLTMEKVNVAVFKSIELKTKNDPIDAERVEGQVKWAKFVRANGGLAEFWIEQADGSVKVETC